MTYDYEYFKREILALTSIDLDCYKEKQMKRRIDTLITKHKTRIYLMSLSAILPLMCLSFTVILNNGN